MPYDSEFEFDSFGNVYQTNTEIEDDDIFDDDDYDDDDEFFEGQFMEYRDSLRKRIENGEPIYSSEIDMYSDLHKDVYGFRPRYSMTWLTEYDKVVNDH